MAGQLGDLIRKRGAEVMSAPALREAPVDCLEMVGELIEGISDGEFQVVVAQTGVGVSTLFKEAAKLGRESELLTGLRKVVCVARGPKPVAALRKAGILTPVKVSSPYTTCELLDTLGEFDLSGCGVALINYGERNEALSETLLSACANLYELCLYEWMLPEDTGPLESLVRAVLKRELDAVAFTSQAQVKHLFKIAEQHGFGSVLAATMNSTVVAAVGPTCAKALAAYGVTPDVVPDPPKMGHMVADLAEYFSKVRTPRP
jgi:uroporphyrinogen-III synthase